VLSCKSKRGLGKRYGAFTLVLTSKTVPVAIPPMQMMIAIAKSFTETGILFSLSKSWVSALLDWAEGSLVAFGAILALGIIGEYSKSDKWKGRKRMFEIMVIVGVAGELFADGGIFLFSRNLQTRSDSELVAMGKRLEQTNADLVEAGNGIRAALRIAADAKRDVASERTAASAARSADLAAISGLADRMTHRHLTADQKQELTRRFSSYRQVPLQIEVVNPDDESEGLAKEVQSVLPLAKIGKFSSNVRFKGIQVIELGGSNHFENAVAGGLTTGLNEIFPDVGPHRRTEPDWGERSNVSGEFFKSPPYVVIVKLAIGKRQ